MCQLKPVAKRKHWFVSESWDKKNCEIKKIISKFISIATGSWVEMDFWCTFSLVSSYGTQSEDGL